MEWCLWVKQDITVGWDFIFCKKLIASWNAVYIQQVFGVKGLKNKMAWWCQPKGKFFPRMLLHLEERLQHDFSSLLTELCLQPTGKWNKKAWCNRPGRSELVRLKSERLKSTPQLTALKMYQSRPMAQQWIQHSALIPSGFWDIPPVPQRETRRILFKSIGLMKHHNY